VRASSGERPAWSCATIKRDGCNGDQQQARNGVQVMKNLAILATAMLTLAAAQPARAQNAPQHLTEPQARAMAMQWGCSNISRLSAGQGGRWFGQCQKGGQTVSVMVDATGKVSQGRPSHVTSGAARADLMQHGCPNVSQLTEDASGTWHGRCMKGGNTTEVTVNQQGQIASH